MSTGGPADAQGDEAPESPACEVCDDELVVVEGDREVPCFACYDFEAEADRG